jgi:predicted transcriptional regulator
MITKEKTLEAVRSLPDAFSIDDVLQKLILIEHIEAGLTDIQEGRVHSSEDVRKRFEQWLR